METQEELYSDTPPSLKTKEVRPFMKSEQSKLWMSIADFCFGFMLKKNFSKIRIKNLANLELRDKTRPNIIYAPHICWWDGILGYYLCRKIFHFAPIGMMEDLHTMPIFRKIGAFSVDKKSPKVVKESLFFAQKNLDSGDKSMFIFPQGIIRPQDYSPLKFSSGISYIASNLEGVNLIPLAIRYCFLRGAAPEILVDVSEPMYLEKIENRSETTERLKKHFGEILEKQRLEIARGRLDEYETVWTGRENIFQIIQKIIKRA